MGKGRTALRFLKALKLYCALADLDPYAYSIFMFDSFEGMPEKQSFRDDHPGFTTGMLSHSIEEIRALLSREIDLGRGNVRLIKGFFADSLTPALASELAACPPAIVTIDVDYYSSTRTALEWLLPFTPSGCLFYFDDVWLFFSHPEMGELAAIEEVNRGGPGYFVPYSELNTTVGGRTYIYVRREFAKTAVQPPE